MDYEQQFVLPHHTALVPRPVAELFEKISLECVMRRQINFLFRHPPFFYGNTLHSATAGIRSCALIPGDFL